MKTIEIGIATPTVVPLRGAMPSSNIGGPVGYGFSVGVVVGVDGIEAGIGVAPTDAELDGDAGLNGDPGLNGDAAESAAS